MHFCILYIYLNPVVFECAGAPFPTLFCAPWPCAFLWMPVVVRDPWDTLCTFRPRWWPYTEWSWQRSGRARTRDLWWPAGKNGELRQKSQNNFNSNGWPITSPCCSLMMVITARWQLAVMVPPTTHHFRGSGSIAYGTKMTNRMYQTRYSRSANPTPCPTNPANRERWKITAATYSTYDSSRRGRPKRISPFDGPCRWRMIYDPLTLDVEEHPCADRRPVQIVVGKTAPVAQKADGHVGNPAAHRPSDGRRHALKTN